MGNGEWARHWLDAIAREDVRASLERVYADAAAAIAERGPACWASGRCCNFAKAGHKLYVTGLEAAYTIAQLPGATSPPLGGATGGSSTGTTGPIGTLHLPTLPDAQACPFQTANLCGVHPIRPLGCRLYFCDRSAQEWQHELSERLLADIRALHDRFAVEYRYGEWLEMLGQFVPIPHGPT